MTKSNKSGKKNSKNIRKTSKLSLNLQLSQLIVFIFTSISKLVSPKKKFSNKIFKNEKINELITFLLIFIIFLIAIKLGPMITGFAVLSHTSSTDFTGTFNRINKFKYLTKQVKNRGIK